MRARLNSIVQFFLRRSDMEQDIDNELQDHLDRQIELNISRGMSPEVAQREAILQIGGVEGLKDEMRDARTGRWIEALMQDIRYGARVLRKNPGFTLAAVLTLALGIGANTAIFSLIYGVLLRPLPYQNGGQLVVLHQQNTKAAVPNVPFSVKELNDYSTQSSTLASVVEHHTMVFLLNDGKIGERVTAGVVSGNFFDVLGVKPILGRTFVDGDDEPNAPPVIVLSHQYWMEHRGGDPNIIGKAYEMNGKPHTVIGVLPAIPQYPNESDLYMTTVQCPTRSSARFKINRRARMMVGFARLKPGVSVDQAQADLSVVASRMQRANSDVYTAQSGYSMRIAALRDDLTHNARTTFLVLLAGAGFVLLIACANVANMMLARLLRFEREMAVRAALGASKLRLLRQLLTECLLVSLTGGLLGLVIAPLTLSMLVKFAARYTTRAAEVHVDAPVLLFTLVVAVGTGVLFGFAPAFTSSKRAADALRQGGRHTATSGRQLLRSGLVVAQVAVSFVLLIGAGLMLRSFVRMNQVNPGFRTDHLLALRMMPNFSKYKPEQLAVLNDNILRGVRAISGVTDAATVSNIPLSPSGIAGGPGALDFTIQGRPLSKGVLAPQVDITLTDPHYFEVIGQQRIAGEIYTERDSDKTPAVAVINQTMAKHHWPGENPVGQKISLNALGDKWMTIIGVVSDTREYGLNLPTRDEVYMPTAQLGGFSPNLIVRTAFDPATATPMIRAALHKVDPLIALDQIGTMEHFEYESMAPPRVMMALMLIFAALALLISTGGIAAVMMLAVTQRSRELGIRMALGADRGGIIGMIVRQGLRLAVVGVVAGVAGALALTRLLSTLLYAPVRPMS